MDRESVDWAGPMPAVVTPFDAAGRVDAAAFEANVGRLLAAGATGIVAGGCTGEFWALSLDERKALYGLAVRAVAGRGTVLVGTGAVRQEDVIELTRHARSVGCDGAVVTPPYFVKLTDDEIFAHFEAVCGAVDLPVCLYNIPGNAVNAISPAWPGGSPRWIRWSRSRRAPGTGTTSTRRTWRCATGCACSADRRRSSACRRCSWGRTG